MRSRITLTSVLFVVLIAAVAMFVSSCEQKQSNTDQLNAAIIELLGHTPEIAWTAPAPGQYEFWILAGTNHIAKSADANAPDAIKLGALTFNREEMNAALASDPAFRDLRPEHLIERNANLDPVKFLITVTE